MTQSLALDDSDAGLVAGARRRSSAAYAAIIRQHNRRLFRIARSILKDHAEAEDAVQDAYIQVLRNIDTLRDDTRLSAWLGRIVVNEALGRLRRRRATVELETIDGAEAQELTMVGDPLGALRPENPEASAARSEVKALLESAIDGLPLHFRMVFVGCAVEQMSIEEAAACFGLPENTVKTRLHRAKRLLRRALGTELEAALPESFTFGGSHCEAMTDRVLTKLAELDGR
jgi:RNA polymerase sigma-70 factor (ECF subfamily)